MPDLSVCIIAKDEEDVIGRLLQCVAKFADETVVVDTGSRDSTKAVAESFGAKIADFEWTDNFSAARDFCFSLASCDYVMWLDCDDVIDDGNAARLIALKPRLSDADIWYMKYATAFDKYGDPTFEYWRERVFRRSLGPCWTDPVHEVFCASGSSRFEDVTVRHEKTHPSPPRRNLDIYLGLIREGAPLSPRQKFYFANELWNNNLTDLAVSAYNDFLYSDGMRENKEQACINLSRIYSAKGDSSSALDSLLRALSLGEPSAELCVALGNAFISSNDFSAATFWYGLALRPIPESTLAFVDVYCYNYYPLVQLGLCAYRQGDPIKAANYTRKALEHKKDDEIALGNLAFYEKIINDQRER